MATTINVNGVRSYLHFAILDEVPGYVRYPRDSMRTLVGISMYARSKEQVSGVWANLRYGFKLDNDRENLCLTDKEPYKNYIQPLKKGKENAYHLMAFSQNIGKDLYICHKDKIYEDLYNLLMNNMKLPLLKEWMKPLLDRAVKDGYARIGHKIIGVDTPEKVSINLGTHGGLVSLDDIEVVRFEADENWVLETLKNLHDEGIIWLTKKPQKPFEVDNIDEYLQRYSHSIVDNLKNIVKPKTELKGTIDNVAFKKIRLYPQQIAVVNGAQKILDTSNYVLMIEGMGTGKTIQSLAICEGRENKKWMRKYHKTFSECLQEDNVHYRTLIMCPGHLPQKWKREIESNVPYAHAEILNSLEDVLKLRDLPKKAQRKEFFIIGKDFCKLSYEEKPAPKRYGRKMSVKKICIQCGEEKMTPGNECDCGSKNFKFEPTGEYFDGLICPSCGQLLYSYQNMTSDKYPLQPKDFASHKDLNDKCFYCGEALWEPCINNINTDIMNVGVKKKSFWYKVSHFANQTKKTKKTSWILKGFEKQYRESLEVPYVKFKDVPVKKKRKISPAYLIKHYLKGFFDYGIFDEAHLYKGAGTAQGNAFAAAVAACKKQLLLSGTIANGYAPSIFYLLYRVDSRKMKKMGYGWNDAMKFAKFYGTVETLYDTLSSDNGNYNSCSRGRQITIPKVKPGISPMLTLDFTLPVEITLDLSDMSKFLPPLHENVEVITIPEEIKSTYKKVISDLKKASREGEGMGCLSQMLQFGMSYPDKPYGRGAILSAKNGSIIAQPLDFFEYVKQEGLLPKEKKLIELIRREQEEGRNVVVFAEYTNSAETIITHRLKEIIEEYIPSLKGKTVILESASPKPIEREEWIHRKAREGAKVIITNPRCVETGLDFVWSDVDSNGNEVLYNFPTLVFFQCGTNLYTVWQASRRGYRLCQPIECRNYYLGYEGMQLEMIKLIAEKQTATQAIQGKFSAEGLAKLAQQTDPRVRLAQSICEADTETQNELQNMFDAINDINNSSTDSEDELMRNYEPMKLFDEIVGIITTSNKEENVQKTADFTTLNFMKFFDMFSSGKSQMPVYKKEQKQLDIMMPVSTGKKKSKKISSGQMELSDLFTFQ